MMVLRRTHGEAIYLDEFDYSNSAFCLLLYYMIFFIFTLFGCLVMIAAEFGFVITGAIIIILLSFLALMINEGNSTKYKIWWGGYERIVKKNNDDNDLIAINKAADELEAIIIAQQNLKYRLTKSD